MKKLATLATLATIGISSVAFAYEASPGVKILSESHSCNAISCDIVHLEPKKKELFSPKAVSTSTYVPEVGGYCGWNSSISSTHNVYIFNQSNQPQRYNMTFTLSVGTQNSSYNRWIDVPPNGTYKDAVGNNLTVNIKDQGDYPIYATTTISGFQNYTDTAMNYLRIRTMQ